MKIIYNSIKTTFLAILALALFAGTSFAQDLQDPTQQVQQFNLKIDKLGDGALELTTKMTQAQWESFKQGPLVNDPSITKRNMERSMSASIRCNT